VTEGGIGVPKPLVTGYDCGWVRVLPSGAAGRNAAVGYHMTGGSLAGRFGGLVRRLRSEAGFSQEEFALRCGLHRTYLGSIERGERNVTIQTADKLARALDTTLADLFVELEKGADPREEQ
jgi:DNA-binding XRE family transcriptional regulator